MKAAEPEVDASTRALLARIERLEGGGGVAAAVAQRVKHRRRSLSPLVARAPRSPASGRPSRERRTAEADSRRGRGASEAAVEPPRSRGGRRGHGRVDRHGAGASGGRARRSAGTIAVHRPRPRRRRSPTTSRRCSRGGRPWSISCATDNALLGACIEEARPVEVTGEDLTVAFSATAPFLKKKAENPDNRAIVTEALRDVTGRRWRLSYELHDELAGVDGERPGALSEEEWVKRFIEEFDAEELPSEDAARANGEAVTNDREGS